MTSTKPASAVAVRRQPFAADRVTRLMSMALAMAGIAILAAYAELIARQWPLLTWSVVLGVVAVSLPPLAVLAMFWWVRPSFLRRLWAVQAVSLLVSLLAVPVALAGSKMPTEAGPWWIGQFAVIGACAAALAWSVRAAVVYVVALELIVFGVALACSADPFFGPSIGDAMRQLFFVAMFMSLAMAIQRAGRLLDLATVTAVAEARASAEADVKRASRHRIEMLVHDSVIVALLAYASGAPAATTAEEAKRALEAMQKFGDLSTSDLDRAPRELAWELQSLTTNIDPQARFDYQTSGQDPIPGTVASALIEATSEALRNSVRHADRDGAARRHVHAELSPDGVDIAVLDDGAGFEIASVSATRLGIRHGIIGRMQQIPGGAAEVRSTTGYGTTVLLRWSPL